MIHEQIECPLYNESVLFYADCTARQLMAHLKKKYDIVDEDIDLTPGDWGLLHSTDAHYILWCRNTKDVPTLVHELYHLCVAIFDTKGVPVNVDNDEAMAYYLAYWLSKLLPIIDKETKVKTFSKKKVSKEDK